MALSKIIAEGVDLTDTFAFTGTVTGAGDVLDATTTVPSEGGAATTNLVQGLTKAWANFNGGGTLTVRDSQGVSSITDVGTGEYEPNLNPAMSSTSYAPVIHSTRYFYGGGNTWDSNSHYVGGVRSTSVIRITTKEGDSGNAFGARLDHENVLFAAVGDLA